MKTFLAITAPWRRCGPPVVGPACPTTGPPAPRARQRVRRPRVPDNGSAGPACPTTGPPAPRARQRVRRPRVPDIGSVSPETEPTHGGGAVPASCSGAPTTVKHRERTVGAACARRACVAGVVSITSITRATARVIHAPTRSAPLLPCTRRPLRKTGYERSEPLFSQRWSYEPGLDGRDACLAPLNMLRASYPGPRTPPRPGTVERASPPDRKSTRLNS